MSKKVVIVGSGYGGAALAKALEKKSPSLDIVVIDRREGQIAKIGGLRGSVRPAWNEAVVVPRDGLLKRGKFIQGSVASIESNNVKLENGEAVPFDYLVIATGSQNASPGEPSASITDLAGMRNFYKQTSEALATANKIVILGGGVVGLEFAGEVRNMYPKMEVTIVHSGTTFVNSAQPPLPKSFQVKIEKQLKALNINYILGDKLNIDVSVFAGKPFVAGLQTVRTSSGKELQADLVFNCSGVRPNSSFLPKEWLDESGFVNVENTFQVKGMDNVFAFGDVAALKESKMAYIAFSMHAPVVAANIISLSKGGKPKKTYTPMGKPFMLIPLGPRKGLTVTPLGVMGPFLTSNIKGKTLFLGDAYKLNGYKATPPKI